jgi:hypothetical protein
MQMETSAAKANPQKQWSASTISGNLLNTVGEFYRSLELGQGKKVWTDRPFLPAVGAEKALDYPEGSSRGCGPFGN